MFDLWRQFRYRTDAFNQAISEGPVEGPVDGLKSVLPNSDKYPLEVTSGANGVVKFDGLKAGSYTVTETAVADGYQDFKASFTVAIEENGNVTFAGTDSWGLAPKDSAADYKVTNVKSVFELPKTGAAGIALFVVIAALLGGAAATVYAKSRRTSRALR